MFYEWENCQLFVSRQSYFITLRFLLPKKWSTSWQTHKACQYVSYYKDLLCLNILRAFRILIDSSVIKPSPTTILRSSGYQIIFHRCISYCYLKSSIMSLNNRYEPLQNILLIRHQCLDHPIIPKIYLSWFILFRFKSLKTECQISLKREIKAKVKDFLNYNIFLRFSLY